MTEINNSLPPYYELAFLMSKLDTISLPLGAIVMWPGNINSIPKGWTLCNGSNGTPDLKDKFILSVTDGENPGAIGGANEHNHTYNDVLNHTHTINDPGHTHDYDIIYAQSIYNNTGFTVYDLFYKNSWSSKDSSSATTGISINDEGSVNPMTDNSSSLPPYHKLAFIMKNTISNVVPDNIALLWAHPVDIIPEGWKFCDGSDGTPDLRDKFILGVTNREDPGAIGGANEHNHTYYDVAYHTHDLNTDLHSHEYYFDQDIINEWTYSPGGDKYFFPTYVYSHDTTYNQTGITLNYVGTENENFKTDNSSSLPPYYKLAIICNILGGIGIPIGGDDDDDDDTEEDPYIWIIGAIIGAAIIVGIGIVAKQSFNSVKKKRQLYELISNKLNTINDVEGYLKSNLWKSAWKDFKSTYDNYMNRKVSYKKLIKKGKKSMGKSFIELFEVKSKKKISK